MHWGHLAADQGDADAMDFVGFAYLTGRGVTQNAGIAFGYFHAAADHSAQGGYNLGQCYFGAQGVDQNIPEALRAWKKAAMLGSGSAAAGGGDGLSHRRRRRPRSAPSGTVGDALGPVGQSRGTGGAGGNAVPGW